jgi:uncharacterized membrane protein YqjE
MAGEPAASGDRTRPTGLIGSLFALAGSLVDFFESRAALFATESKSALVQVIVALISLAGALMFLAFGYLFLLATLVVAISRYAQVSWLTTALVAAGVHIVIALILVVIARAAIQRPVFRETTAELKKDREWLKNLETNHRPN